MFTALPCSLIAIAMLTISPTINASPGDTAQAGIAIYQLATTSSPRPFIVIENGDIIRSYGNLSDQGCNFKKTGAIRQNIDLSTLFNEAEFQIETDEQPLKKSWRSNQWSGKSPFTSSLISIEWNNSAELELTHTITTFLASDEHSGSTLCNRSHRYLARRLN